MDETEYLEAWGEDGGQPVAAPTPERAKHQQQLDDDEDEFVKAFRKNEQAGGDE